MRIASLSALATALLLAACGNTPASTPLDAAGNPTDTGQIGDAAADAAPGDTAADAVAPDTVAADTAPDDTAASDTAPADTAQPDVPAIDVPTADVPPADVAAPDVPPADTAADTTSDATPPNVQCTGAAISFPSFAKTCQADADCVAGLHQINCCGTQVAIGMAKSEQAAFQAAEAVCAAQYPGCGCAQFPTLAEDGFTAVQGNQDIAARCVAGACTSYVTTAKLDCNDEQQGFPKPFKLCQQTTDCTYVLHMTDCCGTQVALGITKTAKAAYEKAEATCNAGKAICDCLPKPTQAEDGQSAGDGLLAVQCEAGQCVSYVKN